MNKYYKIILLSSFGERMTQEVKIGKLSFVPAAILVAFLSFIGSSAIALNGSNGGYFQCRYAWGIFNMTMGIPIWSVLLPLMAFIPTMLGLKISRRNLTTLYVIGMVVSMYGICDYEDFATYPVGFARTQLYASPDLLKITSTWWWMPSQDVVKGILNGGVAPDWSAWAPAIIFWWFFYMTFMLLGSSLMMLLRRRWIDIESVPFPYVLATYGIMSTVHSEEGERSRLTPFILGLVIGLVFELLIAFASLFPWFPDILGFRVNTNPPGCVCLPATGTPWTALTTTIVHPLDYTKNLLPFLVYYLAPLEVTFTAWVFTLVMAVLEQMAYAFGYYTGVFDLGGGCRIVAQSGFETSPLQGPPFYWMYMSGIGGTVALAAMVIYHSRGYIAETITAARGGTTKSFENEPFSYRTIYVMIIISSLLLLAFLFSAGLQIGPALAILIVSGFINGIAGTYALGLSGAGYLFFAMRWPDWPYRLIWPTAPVDEPYNTNWLMSHVLIYTSIHYASSGQLTGDFVSMQGMKMASLTNVGTRNIVLLMISTAPIASLVALTTKVWIINLLGVGRVPIWGACDVAHWCHGSYDEYNRAPPLLNEWAAGAAGFIIVVGLFLLKARYVWWPLHPVGFILATGPGTTFMREWDAFLGAWIAKYLTLRIGGSKIYSEYGIPFVGGGLAGIVIAYVSAYLLGVVKFFIPF
jgi:hypothetical protein